ncbi:MAG TPA: T9SS type A sorting domain-containing protein, partial [Puia sp.]|nr:T9SS type A sorting domain-containing protein [Puia sp.]
ITSTSSPTAFNSFSTFALADQIGGGNILPIGLLNFDARADNSRVDLRWTTSSESNNSYFTIEKSQDAVNFSFLENVNTLAINGNSSTPLNYIAYDMSPNAGVTYYRLKQTDIDGNYTYSGIVSVNFDKKKAVSVYPNPTTGTVYISGLDAGQSSLAVEWLDVSGKSLVRETVAVQNGMVRLDTHFRNGVYFLKFMSSDGNFNMQNVIIMK